jgi:hypothetical protein
MTATMKAPAAVAAQGLRGIVQHDLNDPEHNASSNRAQDRARRRRATFARDITALELTDRYVHRGVGRLTLSYFQFGERR